MTTEKKVSLVDISKRYGNDIRTLDELKVELRGIPTEDLVVSYPDINDFKNSVNDFRDAVRDELVESRIYDADVEEDVKGNKYLSHNGKHLKFNRRLIEKFNKDVAKEILDEKGLYHNTLKRTVKVKDSDFLLDTLEDTIKNLEEIDELNGVKGLSEEITKLKSVLKRGLKVTKTIDEKKLESMVELDFLSKSDKNKMYEEKESYALYVVKEGKK